MINIALLVLLSVIGLATGEVETIFSVKFGDKFGDGWNGAKLSYFTMTYNSSYVVSVRDFNQLDDDFRAYPEIGDKGFEGGVDCNRDEAIYFAMVSGDAENMTMLINQEAPVQAWEIYYQIGANDTTYHGGWNTVVGLSCDGNYTLLEWTENLLEPIGSCPECQHPKPKPKPKPKPRRLGAADDDSKKSKTKPVKYWPVPVKLMDITDRDGWFLPDTMAYAEFTISDASRLNLLAEGTLCAAKGTDGYKTVCETMLPDGHYIFRAAGNLDEFSANYTWQLCGKEAIKYEVGMSDPAITGQNATMQYEYKSATGRMGNEVSFRIKKGKCEVDEVVTIEDYKNGTALDTVLSLQGHLLLENVHFNELSAVESSFLEADINEFVGLEMEKHVTITSVEDGNDGTLVGYRVVAAHAEKQLMHGTMDQMVDMATSDLQTQLTGGGFVNFMKNSLQQAGLGDDKLMSVSTVSFVDLNVDQMVTLHDGETASGEIIAGGDHASALNTIVSGSDEAAVQQDSGSSLLLDVLTASGAFAVVAVLVALVMVTLKPPAPATSTETSTMDNSSANLVTTPSADVSLDVSSTELLPSPSTQDSSALSYEASLSAALTQRWEMTAEDDSVRL